MTEAQEQLARHLGKFYGSGGTDVIPALMSAALQMTMNRHQISQSEAAKLLVIQMQTNWLDLKPEEIDTTRPV